VDIIRVVFRRRDISGYIGENRARNGENRARNGLTMVNCGGFSGPHNANPVIKSV
jgi:hypothetical protein